MRIVATQVFPESRTIPPDAGIQVWDWVLSSAQRLQDRDEVPLGKSVLLREESRMRAISFKHLCKVPHEVKMQMRKSDSQDSFPSYACMATSLGTAGTAPGPQVLLEGRVLQHVLTEAPVRGAEQKHCFSGGENGSALAVRINCLPHGPTRPPPLNTQ